MDADAVFYREWSRRPPGMTRSVRRAGALAAALGVATPAVPVLTVVGSKGKGTAATYASAYLAGLGRRVLTVTSPGLRADTDRIRVGGASITERELAGLGHRLDAAIAALPDRGEREGYLSPSGLFTLAGVLHARDVRADVLVLEAGMGGASDEVSLFPPTVVAITEIFEEHLGVLGDTIAAVAEDKAAVAAERTSAVVCLPQRAPVLAAVCTVVARRTGGRVRPEVIAPGSSGMPRDVLPPGLGTANAELGCVAARRLIDAVRPPGTDDGPAGEGGPAPGAARPRDDGPRPHGIDAPRDEGGRAAEVLASVRLPGRASWHAVPGTGTTVFADSAIDRAGAAAALAEAYRRWAQIDHVLVCVPDHKDVTGVIGELAGLPVTCVRLPDHTRLRFTGPIPAHWSIVDAPDLNLKRIAALGERIVALGTVYFTAALLDLLDVDTTRIFDA